MVIFVTVFVIFFTKRTYKEMASARRNFKNIFSRPLFTVIFRPKIVISGTDSILRVKKMY